jgi:hypothetical protein
MDFLGQHIVHIDFDRGDLLLLRSAPKDAGQVVPLEWKPGERPAIEAWVTSEKRVQFLIDTGQGGFDIGGLEAVEARSLVRSGVFRVIGSTLNETVSGTSSSWLLQGKRLSLRGFRVDGPVFGESPTIAMLGRGFWSRFIVTFDFPGRNVYLSKGQAYERADRWNSSGLHLIRRGEAVIVHSADGRSPGGNAGVQSGDVLLAVDELRAANASLTELRAALCGDGRRTCVVERRGQHHRLTMSIVR